MLMHAHDKGTPEQVTVLSIDPAPEWVSALVGFEVDRMRAWRARASVLLRLEAGDREGSLIEVAATRAEPVVFSLEVATDGRRERRPLEVPVERRKEIARFHGRVLALLGWAGRYRPSRREQRCLQLVTALNELHVIGEATIDRRLLDDPALSDVAPYLDFVEGRWGKVFATAEPLPPWLAPALLAISGDAGALRERAAAAVSGRVDEGPLSLLMGMAYEEWGLPDAALASYRAAERALPAAERADLALEFARLYRTRGETKRAIAMARRALLMRDPPDSLIRRACAELVRNGALGDAYLALLERCSRDPIDAELVYALTELLLWAARKQEARRWLERLGSSVHGEFRWLRAMGILEALEERWSDAIESLERAEAQDPGNCEVATWLSELYLRVGDDEAARRWFDVARVKAHGPVHVVFEAAVYGKDVSPNHAIFALLDCLGEKPERWQSGAKAARKASLDLVMSFGGNRSPHSTRMTAASGDPLGIELVRLPPTSSRLTSRTRSANLLKQIGRVSFAELERRFERLAAEFPESPHPYCYWGELTLWLGDYSRAVELFNKAETRAPARWAFVGRAAAAILQGDYDEGDREIAACNAEFEPVLGATTNVYVGEACRLRGDYTRARSLLQEAVRYKTGRAGAWMNLALCHLALGAGEEAERIFAMLEARHPRLFCDTWHAMTGEAIWPVPRTDSVRFFETALELMRGNRSSHLVSYFDRDGTFRIAVDAERWRQPLARHGSTVALAILNRLAAGIDAG